jgi:hypothetical protein
MAVTAELCEHSAAVAAAAAHSCEKEETFRVEEKKGRKRGREGNRKRGRVGEKKREGEIGRDRVRSGD